MRDIDLIAYRDSREARKVLDCYVQIANSIFEEIKITNTGEEVETLAVGERVEEERILDTESASPMGCVSFFSLQFLAYVFSRLGIDVQSIVKREGELIRLVGNRFPIKEYYILWRKLPELEWKGDSDTGGIIYRCICRVGIVRKND
jgi:hypothetical protein